MNDAVFSENDFSESTCVWLLLDLQFLFPFLLLLYFPFVWWLLLFLPSLISATGGRKTQSSGSPSCNTKQIGLSPDLPFLLTDFKATTLLSFEALSLQPVSRWMMLEGYPYETPPPHKMTQRPIKAWSLNCNGLNSKGQASTVGSSQVPGGHHLSTRNPLERLHPSYF